MLFLGILTVLFIIWLFGRRVQQETPKSYPLPKCPYCKVSEWVVMKKYLHERWFGTGVDQYLLANCSRCGLGVRMVFNRNGDLFNRRGWYFQ